MSAGAELLRALYARHAPGLRRYLARVVGEADAEDLAHDVFERAQRAGPPAEGELAVRGGG
jgi:DNA-directed RNA polymerase specialized sigma24 family protein